MTTNQTETLVVKHLPTTGLTLTVPAEVGFNLFSAQAWVDQCVQHLPVGTEVRLVLQVLAQPDANGWHDATVRLPQPGVFVTVRTANMTQTGRLVDDRWRGEGDVVLFSPVTHWKEIG